jgi:hypothetical protein
MGREKRTSSLSRSHPRFSLERSSGIPADTMSRNSVMMSELLWRTMLYARHDMRTKLRNTAESTGPSTAANCGVNTKSVRSRL